MLGYTFKESTKEIIAFNENFNYARINKYGICAGYMEEDDKENFDKSIFSEADIPVEVIEELIKLWKEKKITLIMKPKTYEQYRKALFGDETAIKIVLSASRSGYANFEDLVDHYQQLVIQEGTFTHFLLDHRNKAISELENAWQEIKAFVPQSEIE